MGGVIDIVGPNRALSIFGVKLVGFTAENGMKLLLTVVLALMFWGLARLLRRTARFLVRGRIDARTMFWSNQAISITVTVLFLIAFVSIWFDDPTRLATALGLVTAGLAFALQRVVTSIAGYYIILRGRLFNLGDRISLGGVRGDVISVGFTHTTVMEMGQPPSVQMADPAMWVEARQYTGRVVTITNDKVFDSPVYNYSREFPYLWEEMHVMIPYSADRKRAEQILLAVAEQNTVKIAEMGEDALRDMERRYFVRADSLEPKVYYRLTDNWLELTVRFVCRSHGIRDLKDVLSRGIIEGFAAAGIPLASTTIEVVGLPPVQVRLQGQAGSS
ncbi:MAG: mechanosensitive ion channel protein MscS [Planctomycetes bacterium RBG_13_60_9]|nr:MAG: mechanosensitive ion channel protein MscS [Planctomycetes bacterium RBG_13_60_9]